MNSVNRQDPFDGNQLCIDVPEPTGSATVEDLVRHMTGTWADATVELESLPLWLKNLRNMTLQVNTVRGHTHLNSPQGNALWLASAAIAQSQGNRIEVNGFYTRGPNEHSEDISMISQSLYIEPNTSQYYRAENFGFHQKIFDHLCIFISRNRSDIETLLFHEGQRETHAPVLQFGTVRIGFQAVLDGRVDDATSQLARLIEELHVFMHRFDDPNVVMLLNHERLTPALCRTLYSEYLQKKFIHVPLLGDINEFRRNAPGGSIAMKYLFRNAVRVPRNEGQQHAQALARAVVAVLSEGGDEEYRLECLDARLSEWHAGDMSATTISDLFLNDGCPDTPAEVIHILTNKNKDAAKPSKLLHPLKALVTKKRGDLYFIFDTYLALIAHMKQQGDEDSYTMPNVYCVANPLLDAIVSYAGVDHVDKGIDVAEKLESLRSALEENLSIIAQAAWRAYFGANKIFGDIDIPDLEEKLSTLLEKKITLAMDLQCTTAVQHLNIYIARAKQGNSHFVEELIGLFGSKIETNQAQQAIVMLKSLFTDLQEAIEAHCMQEFAQEVRCYDGALERFRLFFGEDFIQKVQ